MPFMLDDLSPTAIITAMEANFSDYYLAYTELPQGEIHYDPGCTWFMSGVPEKWFNGVVHTHLDQHQLESRVKSILAEFRQRALPFLWHITPGTQPPALEFILLNCGLHLESAEPGMAVNLTALNKQTHPPANLTIEPVLDRLTLEEWMAVWLAETPEPIARHCREVLYTLGVGEHRPWRYYLGRVQGKPVATIQLYYAAGIVSVQHVATLSEARRCGFATALIVHALREAYAQGYRIAGLTATPAGLPVYQRIGFQTYATFRSYSGQPDRPVI
jgi:GNAT superfamily N-acetyltransferase